MYGNVITYNDVIVVGIHGNIDALESKCLFWMQQFEGSEVNGNFSMQIQCKSMKIFFSKTTEQNS